MNNVLSKWDIIDSGDFYVFTEEQVRKIESNIKRSIPLIQKGLIEQTFEDIEKAENDLGELTPVYCANENEMMFVKAKKDLSKLQKKVIVDKNGRRKTVYTVIEDDGNKKHFSEGDKVKFKRKGEDVIGKIVVATHEQLRKQKKGSGAVLIEVPGDRRHGVAMKRVEHISGNGSHHLEGSKIISHHHVNGEGELTEIGEHVQNVIKEDKPANEKINDLYDAGVKDKKDIVRAVNADYSVTHEKVEVNKQIDPTPDNMKSLEELGKLELPELEADERWDNYEDYMGMIAEGTNKFLLAYGRGGVGKTYTMKKVFNENKLVAYDEEMEQDASNYDYVKITGKATPTAVYKTLYQHNGKIIVFDDCDSAIAHEEVQGFLKGALDTDGDGTIAYGSSAKLVDKDGMDIPKRFRFQGQVVAITNLPPNKIDQAVKSRALASDLTMNADETLGRIEKIMPKIKFYSPKGEEIQVDEKYKNLALKEIKKYRNTIDPGLLNVRTLMNASLTVKKKLEQGKPYTSAVIQLLK